MREIEPKPSRLLGLLLLGMALLVLVAIYLAALPGAIQLGLGGVVTGLSAWSWRQACSLDTLRVTPGGQLRCPDEVGEWHDVEVLGDSLASPGLIVLRYRSPAKRVRTLVLLPDSAEADDLRRLRVLLRWASHTRSDTASPDAG
ncbi:MAG: protein YgfX [Thiobacillus sp.]